jgi:hypothetical protein
VSSKRVDFWAPDASPPAPLPPLPALRYVTQRPWTRIPCVTKTVILNPIVGCLAGGRNKGVAAKAYAALNDDMAAEGTGLKIRTPFTVSGRGLAGMGRSWGLGRESAGSVHARLIG